MVSSSQFADDGWGHGKEQPGMGRLNKKPCPDNKHEHHTGGWLQGRIEGIVLGPLPGHQVDSFSVAPLLGNGHGDALVGVK